MKKSVLLILGILGFTASISGVSMGLSDENGSAILERPITTCSKSFIIDKKDDYYFNFLEKSRKNLNELEVIMFSQYYDNRSLNNYDEKMARRKRRVERNGNSISFGEIYGVARVKWKNKDKKIDHLVTFRVCSRAVSYTHLTLPTTSRV